MSKHLSYLPPQFDGKSLDLETKEIMREASKANRKLAELKGYSEIVPNKNILINAIALNEAKESSEIENIITTHDELFSALSKSEYLFYNVHACQDTKFNFLVMNSFREFYAAI